MKKLIFSISTILLIVYSTKSFAQVCFDSVTYVLTGGTNGSFPVSIVSEDFNGDGKKDLAVANTDFSNVSVSLGTGTGAFGTTTEYAVSNNPSALCSADFNGDGIKDLATDGSLLLGTGTGSFSAATPLFLSGAGSMVSVDFNKDGHPDLVGAKGSVYVALNTGTGSFGGVTTFASGSGYSSLLSADFNNDSNIDLAVANSQSNTISVILGTGTGSFSAATNFTVDLGPIPMCTGDFNGDNNIDLVVSNGLVIDLLLGTGTGSFAPLTTFTVSGDVYSLISRDFDGDGKADLAVGNVNNYVAILLGNGTGIFGAETDFPCADHNAFICSADFNNDGKPDIATTSTRPSPQLGGMSALVNCAGVGIAQFANVEQIHVYPNPATDVLNVELEMLNEKTEIKLFDVLGNKVLSTTQKQIDVRNLQNGIYFVQVKTNEGVLSKKIIVQK